MRWDYVDFSQCDHRVKLFLELNVMSDDPNESVLLMARSAMQTRSMPRIFTGVLVVTNMAIYILKISKEET